MDPQFFQEPIEVLLQRLYFIESFASTLKYETLTWSEFFAIKLLWKYSPETLLTIFGDQVADVPMEPQNSDVVRLSLLSQIIGVISLSVLFDINERQRDLLLHSSNGLLHWMGLNAIEMQLKKPEGLGTVLGLLDPFPYPEKVRALGWMIQHVAENPGKVEIYNGLVDALLKALPSPTSAEDLRNLVDSMRGHMWQLARSGPWLFQDVVNPLLQKSQASYDDASDIWFRELVALLEQEPKQQPVQFDQVREGQLTKITTYLFANSSLERQRASLELIQTILNRQSRIIRQPLASTSDWTRWDNALVFSMWILSFARWGQYYLQERGIINTQLDDLFQKARDLAMVRSIDEWHSDGPGARGQLAKFLDQVEKLDDDSNQF